MTPNQENPKLLTMDGCLVDVLMDLGPVRKCTQVFEFWSDCLAWFKVSKHLIERVTRHEQLFWECSTAFHELVPGSTLPGSPVLGRECLRAFQEHVAGEYAAGKYVRASQVLCKCRGLFFRDSSHDISGTTPE